MRRALIVVVSACALAVPAGAVPALAGTSLAGTALAGTGLAAGSHRTATGAGAAGLSSPLKRAVAQAQGQAKSSGKAVTIAALTTATSVTSADPDGQLTVDENVLPVRVARGSGWVPVSTALTRTASGTWAAAAVPGDSVSFSGGGAGPAAVISLGGASLAVSWPGRLPAPAVSGSSATYRNVLPGVDLVLTATTAQAGGFSEVLEVHSAAAARNPALARLALGLRTTGTSRPQAYDGGVLAAAPRAGVYFLSPKAVMWDSSTLSARAPRTTVASRLAAARQAGGFLAGNGMGATSSATGPAQGAREATVQATASGGGTTETLAPDTAMLASTSTVWPVFIDPTYNAYDTLDGTKEDFVPVQSEDDSSWDCANETSDFNDTADFPVSPVGYNNWGGECANKDTDYTYYQLKIPTAIWGSSTYVDSAVVNAAAAYSSECGVSTTVELSWSDGIAQGTDWAHQPGDLGDITDDSVGTNSGSCNTVEDNSDTVAAPFTVTSLMQTAANDSWPQFTFRLWEDPHTFTNYDNDYYHKQFTDNPNVQITFNQTPNAPSGLQFSSGGSYTSCSGSTPYLGKLTSSLTLSATVTDPDSYFGMEGEFWYSTNGGSTWTSSPLDSTTNVSSGAAAKVQVAASVINGLADGTKFEWYAEATDGPSLKDSTSGKSSTCTIIAEPTTPPAPTVGSVAAVPGQTCTTSDITGDCEISFTITSNNAASDPATKFVWEQDQEPATSNPPSGQVIPLLSGQTSATKDVWVPGPGPHAIYAYAEDAAGNVSADSGTSDPATFTAQADPPVTYSSWSAALAAKQPWDNAMISTGAGESGAGNADGDNASLPAEELEAGGWNPGGQVTVDGATFTLPDFGTGSPDNLLAANQTINLPTGSQGTSLVFLATAANGHEPAPDAAGLPTTSQAMAPTAPFVTGGTGIAESQCTNYSSGLNDSSGNPYCTLPEGVITYSGGATEDYPLEVPDWVNGPQSEAVMETPDRYVSSGSQVGVPTKIFAFAVPLNPGTSVTSVTLPDVGGQIDAGNLGFPALHILGMAVANTTTATPGGGALPSGQTWTGSWASPMENVYGYPAPTQCVLYPATCTAFQNQTFRTTLHVSAGGSAVRLKLTNYLDWLDGSTASGLGIGQVTVAQEGSGAALSGTVYTATFGSSDSELVDIPEGADVYSNPVPMTVTPGENLAVSVYLSAYVGEVPASDACTQCTTYEDGATGNATTTTSATGFTEAGDFAAIVGGVDVQTSGTPTVVVLGNNVTDAFDNSGDIASADPRVTGDLASSLQSQAGSGNQPAFGVVDESVESGMLATDWMDADSEASGPAALSSLAENILAEPNVGTVIVNEGLEDLLQADTSATETELTGDAYPEMANLLNAWGISAVFATMTPCGGYTANGETAEDDACGTAVESARVAANQFILQAYPTFNSGGPPCLVACDSSVDFAGAVGNTATSNPEDLLSADNAGDDVNLTSAGYAALAATIPDKALYADMPVGY